MTRKFAGPSGTAGGGNYRRLDAVFSVSVLHNLRRLGTRGLQANNRTTYFNDTAVSLKED